MSVKKKGEIEEEERPSTILECASNLGAGDEFSIEIPISSIVISVISLSNPADESNSNDYFVNVYHKDCILLECQLDKCQNADTKYAELEVNATNVNEISQLINHPILISVHEIKYMAEEMTPKKGKSQRKKNPEIQSIPLGCCNIDLFPLFNGNDNVMETLLLHPPKDSLGAEMISWPNLATITIRTTITHPTDCEPLSIANLNMIDFTVESIFNVPSYVSQDFDCLINSIVPKRNEEFEEVLFCNGCPTKSSNVDAFKKWASLSQVEGRCNISKYNLLDLPMFVMQKLDVKAATDPALVADCYRVQWNQLHRCVIDNNDVDFVKKYITDERSVPMEIVLIPKQLQTSGKSTTRKKDPKESTPVHLMAFPDISRLLYPGECILRVVAPIYLYNKKQIVLNKWTELSTTEEMVSVKTKKDKKQPVEEPLTTSPTASATSQTLNPMFNENGEPVFIIIQVEFAKPLQKKKNIEDINEDIYKIIPLRHINIGLENALTAKNKYHKCIKDSIALLKEEYPKFIEATKTFSFEATGDDEMSSFMRYLTYSGSYDKIITSLTSNVTNLINNNFKIGDPFKTMLHYQEFISSAYIELVQEMHKVINSNKVEISTPTITVSELQYFAREAEALEDKVTAEKFYLLCIRSQENLADRWFDYAVFSLNSGDYEKAFVAIYEALQIDHRHKLGLLLCGILLILRDKIRDAEMFFLALMTMYPSFVEGWVAAHIYYKLVERFEAADFAEETANKLVVQDDYIYEKNYYTSQDEFVWYDTEIDDRRIFLKSAALFMRLRCLEFTELALAEDLTVSGPSLMYNYLLATLHYFQRRYIDSLSHLEQSISEYGLSYYLGSLEGHCYSQLGSLDKALHSFELALVSFNCPDDKHLVYILLGQQYLLDGNFESAKKMYITCCNFSPSPVAWLGAAIASFKMGSNKDCEECLKEANYLDRHNPIIWAHLAILYLTLSNKNNFKQCYIMALKNELKDESLLMEIKKLSNKLFFEDDDFAVDNDNIFIF